MKQPSLERTAWFLLLLHALVSLFGVVGIAVMVPNSDLWSGWGWAVSVFPLVVQQGGNMQIYVGAAAVMAFGAASIGWRPTLIFFGASVLLSLTLELTGTSYGWPFGKYEYTDMFGFKILGKVPPAIPLSWFSMGFSSFGLATALIRSWRGSAAFWPSLLLGSVLLTAWDLVLDPAMSQETLAFQYWIWEDVGPYMGIPLVNFLGWVATGAVMMFAASFFDNRLRPIRVEQESFFLLMYLCNLFFAIGICLGNGLWLPVMLGMGVGALVLAGWLLPRFKLAALRGEV